MPKVTVIINTPKYSSVWYRIDLSIPSLYCGAKYCRSGTRSDFQLLKTEPEWKQRVYQAYLACWESYNKCA